MEAIQSDLWNGTQQTTNKTPVSNLQGELSWIWSCSECAGYSRGTLSGGMTAAVTNCPECSHERCESCKLEFPKLEHWAMDNYGIQGRDKTSSHSATDQLSLHRAPTDPNQERLSIAPTTGVHVDIPPKRRKQVQRVKPSGTCQAGEQPYTVNNPEAQEANSYGCFLHIGEPSFYNGHEEKKFHNCSNPGWSSLRYLVE